MSREIAIILAGGRGKRMDILCHVRPKPALPFAGRFRVIDFTLSNCIHSKVKDIAVLADYQRSHLVNYLRHWNLENASPANFDILKPGTGSYKGTADAVYQNLDYLQKHHSDTVLVLAGDHIYKMDYRNMLAFHEQTKADATVGVITVPTEQACRFGTVTVDADRRISGFVEKSESSQSNLASMGIYIFNKDVLIERLTEDAAEDASPHDFGYAILPKMVKRNKVFAYKFNGYWQDIGTIEAYYEANMQLLQKQPPISLNGAQPIFTGETVQAPVREFHQGSVVNSLISPGCVIKGHVENSILSPGVWIDEHAVVRNSILMSNVFVGYYSTIESCILDEAVNIGKICYVGFGTGQTGTAACTVIGREVRVPPHTAIGRDCRIAPYSRSIDFSTNSIPQNYRFVREQYASGNALVYKE
ncbi:MAG: glucose-1-phosphate adenylyltransferase [Dehalococcoidales bacterium]|nr:glucose-1-phosphate adenylyltransferase [Dehalococcoidales bacterium]